MLQLGYNFRDNQITVTPIWWFIFMEHLSSTRGRVEYINTSSCWTHYITNAYLHNETDYCINLMHVNLIAMHIVYSNE